MQKLKKARRDGAVTQGRVPVGQIDARFPERQKEAETDRWTAWLAPLPQGVIALILEPSRQTDAICYVFADTATGQDLLCRALVALHRKADRETLRTLRRLLDEPEPWEPIIPRPPDLRPIPEPRYKILPVPPVFWVPDTQRRRDD